MFFRTLLFGALSKLLGAIIQQKIFQHFWNSFNNLMGAIIQQKTAQAQPRKNVHSNLDREPCLRNT